MHEKHSLPQASCICQHREFLIWLRLSLWTHYHQCLCSLHSSCMPLGPTRIWKKIKVDIYGFTVITPGWGEESSAEHMRNRYQNVSCQPQGVQWFFLSCIWNLFLIARSSNHPSITALFQEEKMTSPLFEALCAGVKKSTEKNGIHRCCAIIDCALLS